MAKKPKTKILTQLRINEISAVNAGAGIGCEVRLRKRSEGYERWLPFFSKIFERHSRKRDFLGYGPSAVARYYRKQGDGQSDEDFRRDGDGYRRDEINADAADADAAAAAEALEAEDEALEGDDTGDSDDAGNSDVPAAIDLVRHARDLIVEVGNRRGEAIAPDTAVRWLLWTKHGHQFLRHLRGHPGMNKRAAALPNKETPMASRTETLSAIAKQYGIEAVAKHVVENGPSGLSEHDLTAMFVANVERRQGKSPAQAFSRAFSASDDRALMMRKAIAVCKGFGLPPHEPIETVATTGTAYDQLMIKASEARRADPSLSQAQAFKKVYEDPSNIEIAKRERLENRPAA